MTPPAPSPAVPRRRRLPVALYILAVLMLLKAATLLGIALAPRLGLTAENLGVGNLAEVLARVQLTPGAAAILVLFGLLLVVSVLGMLSRRRLGWLLAMVITGMFVALDIYGFVAGSVDHLWMLLNIVTVFYLNQADVREVVGAGDLRGRRIDEPVPGVIA